MILYVYAQNYRTTKYVKQKLKGEIDKSTNDQITKWKCNKDVKEFNTTDQQNLICIYSVLHSTIDEYTFFSSMHAAYIKRDYILAVKQTSTYLKEFKSYKAYSLTTMASN